LFRVQIPKLYAVPYCPQQLHHFLQVRNLLLFHFDALRGRLPRPGANVRRHVRALAAPFRIAVGTKYALELLNATLQQQERTGA